MPIDPLMTAIPDNDPAGCVGAFQLAKRLCTDQSSCRLTNRNIEQLGKPGDLYNTPANTFVAGFIGAPQMNSLAVSVDGKTLTLVNAINHDLPMPHPSNGLVRLGIRPEGVLVSLDGEGDRYLAMGR